MHLYELFRRIQSCSGFGKTMNSVHFNRGFNGLHTEIQRCWKGTTWLRIPSSEEFPSPWKARVTLYTSMGCYKTTGLALLQRFPVQGLALPSNSFPGQNQVLLILPSNYLLIPFSSAHCTTTVTTQDKLLSSLCSAATAAS